MDVPPALHPAFGITIAWMAKTTTNTDLRPYILHGKKIGFKTLRKEDAAVVAPWFSDLEFVTCLTSRGLPMSMANEEEWFDQNTKNTEKSVQFGIFELKSGRQIGGCGLFDFTRHNTATFGIGIGDRTAWGKGYGTEATRLMAEYGFFFLNLHNIRLWVFGFNERAIRAYAAAGYKEAGRVRGAIVVAGERYDDVVMDITREDVDLTGMRKMVPLLK
jgi:RimJ/RimL family protein N-acetyltransferase